VFRLFGGSGFSEVQRSHSWLKKNYADIAAFRGFLARRAGIGVPFWMPSATSDFTLVASALSSNTAIDVAQNDYEKQVNAHPARRDIIILLRNGSYILKRISSATTTADGNTRLVFADTLGVDITPEDVKRISYLSLYRFTSNDIVLNWQTRGVLTCEATLINNRTSDGLQRPRSQFLRRRPGRVVPVPGQRRPGRRVAYDRRRRVAGRPCALPPRRGQPHVDPADLGRDDRLH